jgi:hypothetical protein
MASFGRTLSALFKTDHTLQGIFCANFGALVGGLPRWRNVWCPTCYKELPGKDFLVYRPTNEAGEDKCAPGKTNDFRLARAGDHLFFPFECDFCSFYKIKGYVPVITSQSNQRLLTYIQHANLDAYWSRRPSTVKGLVNVFMEQVATGETMFDAIGPFTGTYNSGMEAEYTSLL